MKQSEKTKNTYNKILQSAIEEFGEKGYDNASLNTICTKYSISKGLIYHNFKNKDELYLRSVEECFTKLVKYLKEEAYSNNYEGTNKIVIHDFSEHVLPGQKIAIVGPTGAGKTTRVYDEWI